MISRSHRQRSLTAWVDRWPWVRCKIKRRYVSFHLIPVYAIPALAKTISISLQKRRQRKSCFNFTSIEPAHVKELAALTKRGASELEQVDLPWARKRP